MGTSVMMAPIKKHNPDQNSKVKGYRLLYNNVPIIPLIDWRKPTAANIRPGMRNMDYGHAQ